MCGIIGTVGVFTNNTADFMWHGLFLDSIRGYDSTGIAGANGNRVEIIKEAMAGYNYVFHPQYKKFMSISRDVLIGHNRAATKGSIMPWNAHPFQHGDITLVHNGTLTSWTDLTNETYGTDSETICKLLSTSEDVEKSLEKLEGAYSLVWYNSKTKSIHFARNKDRPMQIAWVRRSTRFVFGSDPDILKFASAKAGWDLEALGELPVGEHWEIGVDAQSLKKGFLCTQFTPKKPTPVREAWNLSNNNAYKKKEIIPIKINILEVRKALAGPTGASPIKVEIPSLKEAHDCRTWFLQKAALQDILTGLEEKKKFFGTIDSVNTAYGCNTVYVRDIFSEDEIVDGPDGFITVEEWAKLTEKGCTQCAKPLSVANTAWFGKEPVCGACEEELIQSNVNQLVVLQ